MKKILALLLALTMMFALVACGSEEAAEEVTEAVKEVAEEVKEEATESVEEVSEAVEEEVEETMTALPLMNEGKLTVGVEIGYPPFEDFAEDGVTPIGYDIDFGYALADKLGLELLHINTAWDGIFQGIDSNYDVVISAVTITDERKETMSFSDPYIDNYQAVVVAKGSGIEVAGFEDLEGLSIAVQKETTSDVLMSDYIATGSITATISANEKVTTCFTQLENGEVDAVVVDSTVANGYVSSNPDAFEIVFADDSEPEQFGVAMGKDNVELQAAINAAIAELTEEGFFVENVAHWFGSAE